MSPGKMLKMKTAHTFDMSGSDYYVTWCNIPEEQNPQLHHCKTPNLAFLKKSAVTLKLYLKNPTKHQDITGFLVKTRMKTDTLISCCAIHSLWLESSLRL
jgi:desulfoferrodoxin (superoxide reductase-like protein)